MANTPAVYPTSLVTFTTKVNHIDVYEDDHINKIQNEVVALQTYIGTNPHGDLTNLSSRVKNALSGSGGFVLTTGIPTTTFPGLFYYRTDSETLFNIRSDNTPQGVGGSLANVAFSFSGVSSGTLASAMYVGTGLNPSITDANLGRYVAWSNNTGAYGTSIVTKFKKISGMTTLRVWAYQKGCSGDDTGNTRITIGSVSGTAQGAVTTTYVWDSVDLDLSGLANGTTYDVIIELKSTSNSRVALLSSIIGIVT